MDRERNEEKMDEEMGGLKDGETIAYLTNFYR
jgi:hypothetical protein